MSHREVCERAKTFGVRTDAEIKRYEGQRTYARTASAPHKQDEPGFTLELTDHEIDQIAIAFFHGLERDVQSSGGYRKGVTCDNRRDVLIELTEEYEESDAIHVGDQGRDFRYPDRAIETAFHHKAFQQLIKYRFLKREDYEEVFQRQRGKATKEYRHLKVSAELKASPSFQRLPGKLT